MKKIILGLVAIIAIIGFTFFFLSSKKSSTDIYLYTESGSVMMKETKEMEYKAIPEKKFLLKNGSYVKTEKGLAHIVFPNNAVTSLGENAEMQITYKDSGVSILQLMGDTYHRVQELTQGKSYEVRTPGTLAAVRGTKFAVSYNATAKKAKVAVTERKVLVSRDNATTTTQPTEVSTGSLANVDENLPTNTTKSITVSLTKNDPSIKNWLDRNTLIDQYADSDPNNFFGNFVNISTSKDLRDRLEKTKTSILGETQKPSKGTLRTLLEGGASQKCTTTSVEDGVASAATIYLSGKKMRVDSKVTTKGIIQNMSMIITYETMYIWGDNMPGIRMPVPTTETTPEVPVPVPNLDYETNYSCSPWTVDESYFTPPRNVGGFVDIKEVMQNNLPTTDIPTTGSVDMRALQCATCDKLPEPDKTACRQAVGCR